MDAKRAIAMVVAFCVGLGIGAAALYALRPPPRTVVDPIEVESGRDEDGSRSGPRKRPRHDNEKDDARRNPDSSGTQGSQDDDGAAPAPPPQGPASDDDDDGSGEADDDDGDDGGGDE